MVTLTSYKNSHSSIRLIEKLKLKNGHASVSKLEQDLMKPVE